MGKKKLSKKSGSRRGTAAINKSAKKAVRKAGKKKAGRRGSTARGGGLAPVPVRTGRGATPAEVGRSLVALFNQGKGHEAEARWWSPGIESVEGMGLAWRGRRAVEAKNAQWMSEHVLHGGSAEGPFVGASGFAVRFRIDVENKASGHRQVMDEIGVYTVRDGKIVREEFMYADAAPRAEGSLPG